MLASEPQSRHQRHREHGTASSVDQDDLVKGTHCLMSWLKARSSKFAYQGLLGPLLCASNENYQRGLHSTGGNLQHPSTSFFVKQLSMIRFFSFSNFSARLIPAEAPLPFPLSICGLAPEPGPLDGPRCRCEMSLICAIGVRVL